MPFCRVNFFIMQRNRNSNDEPQTVVYRDREVNCQQPPCNMQGTCAKTLFLSESTDICHSSTLKKIRECQSNLKRVCRLSNSQIRVCWNHSCSQARGSQRRRSLVNNDCGNGTTSYSEWRVRFDNGDLKRQMFINHILPDEPDMTFPFFMLKVKAKRARTIFMKMMFMIDIVRVDNDNDSFIIHVTPSMLVEKLPDRQSPT